MNTTDLAQSLEVWAADVTSFSHYEHAPTEIRKALPLVICEITGDSRTARNPNLPQLSGYQQAYVRSRVAELQLMVYPEDSWTASQALYEAVDLLGESLRADPTLGGRVYQASPFYEATYNPPEVEYADGTVARIARLQITVGELVEVG